MSSSEIAKQCWFVAWPSKLKIPTNTIKANQIEPMSMDKNVTERRYFRQNLASGLNVANSNQIQNSRNQSISWLFALWMFVIVKDQSQQVLNRIESNDRIGIFGERVNFDSFKRHLADIHESDRLVSTHANSMAREPAKKTW